MLPHTINQHTPMFHVHDVLPFVGKQRFVDMLEPAAFSYALLLQDI